MFGGNGCNFIASTRVLLIDTSTGWHSVVCLCNQYDEIMTWWCFSHYWNFVSGIHQLPVDSFAEVLGMPSFDIWVRSWNCGCVVTWFYYPLIAKPGNNTAAVSWPDPFSFILTKLLNQIRNMWVVWDAMMLMWHAIKDEQRGAWIV